MKRKLQEIKDKLFENYYLTHKEEIEKDIAELIKYAQTTKNKHLECELYAYANELSRKFIYKKA